ncbi:helix-turn-helix domain-containing protein [Parahaliea aestuarii]|uniref:Helix-turn-helix transcriptional regulator n=1 Tax=Parahaliea aestuarii TaxID=1852021 RepID=A0A5C8ZXV3_9GAMM|nr:helix-turn-helix transcriptional regulator [Parahaliea aestuarii]TXS93288.1 helix-turn-helix transcriptional regulator [Parahaliea aestuarii]
MTDSATGRALQTLPRVIDSLGGDDFCAALLDFINSVTPFDSGVIMGYPESGELRVVHNALHAGDQSGFGGPYRDGLWLLSPLYLSAKAGVRGFFHIPDIAPDNFSDSHYYALYYSSNGVIDHCGFLVETGDGTPLAISLERTPALHRFRPAERRELRGIADTVAALVRRNWSEGLTRGTSGDGGLHTQVEAVLEAFGSSRLTPRERDVVQRVLRGYPSKAVARELGISTQTEQVHRKNIYQKLGLSSHNELFSLFFDALAQPFCPGEDPLAGRYPTT